MTTLTKLYRSRAEARVHLSHLEEDYAGRAVAITPAEGWPGKNAEQRDVEKSRAELADATLAAIRSDLRQTKDDIERIQAAIDGLEAERRDEEWRIRARLIDALDRSRVQPNGNGHNGSRVENAFDDAALGDVERLLFEQANGGIGPIQYTATSTKLMVNGELTDAGRAAQTPEPDLLAEYDNAVPF